jgi:hypothetical protein
VYDPRPTYRLSFDFRMMRNRAIISKGQSNEGRGLVRE